MPIINAFAGGELPGFYQTPGLNANRTTVNHNADEHIDPFTGMLQLHHVDMVWPGNGGFDLVLQRSYNSPSPWYGSASDTMSFNRTPNLGIGWNLLIGGRTSNVYGAGAACAGGNQLMYETPDGARQAFVRTSDGSFLSASRWRAVCLDYGVRVFAPNGTHYDLQQPIPEAIPNTITIGTFYYPTRIEDRNGNYATFSYGTMSGVTRLNSITTSDGRTLTFNYAIAGAVHLLDNISDGARTWKFNYATPATLVNPKNHIIGA